jgi:4-amino-4-deoxy-L-arabinose transferase-like glycosyltransferase
VAALLALALLAYFSGLGRSAITDSDEAYYAEAAREMLVDGDWLTPHFNGNPRWDKPVLYYWLTAATFALAGSVEWAARFWSAASGVGLVILTWSVARGLTGRLDVSWLAGLIVAVNFGYSSVARAALPDLPLTFTITLSVWAALRAGNPLNGPPRDARPWWILAGCAAALGFLLKGPVALAVPAVVLIPVWWRERRLGILRSSGFLLALVTFFVIGLPWYVGMWLEHGSEWARSFFVGDNLERFATARFNEPRPFWFYAPVVLGGILPWSAYVCAVLLRSLLQRARHWRPVSPQGWVLVCWTLMPLVFYTLSVGKQPRYVLPVLPPLAVATARLLTDRVGETRRPSGAATDLAVATWVTALLLATLSALAVRARGLFIHSDPWIVWTVAGVAGAAAALLAWLAASRSWVRLPALVAGSTVPVLLAIQFGALGGARPAPVERMAELIQRHRTSSEAVGQYGVFVRNLSFYTTLRHEMLSDEPGAVRFLGSQARVLLVVRPADLLRLETLAGVTTRLLGQVDYLDTAAIRLSSLIDPDPSTHISTVLLVANR